jgi:NAD(P)H-dependent flavin oxidoreductase YrpB (nitropropane dioxygenase family)
VLGAAGAWTGSVWLATSEAETTDAVRAKLIAARAADTVRSRASTGRPARQLRSAWTEAWDRGPLEPLGMPHQGVLYAEPQVRVSRAADAGHRQATELLTYFAGQVVGRLDRVRPAAEVFAEITSECEAIMRGVER